jgi:hypothetical protein
MELVRRGAALLDRERPGWENEINLLNLDLQSPRSCVLGQLYDEFVDMNLFEYGFDYAIDEIPELIEDDGPQMYGFDIGGSQGMIHDYALLDEAWEVFITARRAQNKAYETYRHNILAADINAVFVTAGIRTAADIAANLKPVMA